MEKLLFDQLKELQVMANKENLFEAVKYLAEIIDQNFDKIEQEIDEPTIYCKKCAHCKQINETKGECWGMKDILMAKFFDINLDRVIYSCEYYKEKEENNE